MPITRQKAALDAQFVYTPLDKGSASSFRIITVLPGEYHTPITCTISQEEWRDPADCYEAISYSWGDRLHHKTIFIDEKSLRVTSNLESALRHLRHREQGQHLRLWVDAICINQTDSDERSQQVRQMFHIYNRAKQVIIWLGDETSDSKRAFNFIDTCLAPCFESVDFSCTDEQTNIASGFWEGWDEGKEEECRACVEHLMTRIHAKDWSNVVQVLSRTYWSRAWAVQELISAQKARVVCGTLSLQWPLFDMTIQVMLRNTKIEGLYSESKRELFHIAVENAYAVLCQRSHRVLGRAHFLDFVMLTQTTRDRGCQDPRDKIFSVLSLLPDEFQASFYPDYSQSIEMVYATAVKTHILLAGDLHILSSCCLSKQCSIPNLPSWVPDWGKEFEMSFLGGYSAADTDYCFRASGDSSAAVSFSDSLRLLTVSGLGIDTVRNSKLQKSEYDFDYWYDDESGQKEPSCSWDIHEIVAELEKSGKQIITGDCERSVLEAMCQTLIVSRDLIRAKRRPSLELTKQGNKMWPEPLEDYLALVRLWTRERSLILSASGYIGLAPAATLPGDKICVLYGGHMPIVLRPQADNSYVVVGDAYIHALMDGEAMAPSKAKKFKREVFTIK